MGFAKSISAASVMAADGSSTDILAIANSPVLWLCALAVFLVIFVQTGIYVQAARKAAPNIGMSPAEVRTAFRAGAVASIGPSAAVVLVALSLLALFGVPAVLVRFGLMGSGGTELASATVAAQSTGAELGGDTYTQKIFVIAFVAMTLSGAMWMLATLILTPILRRGTTKATTKNPAAMLIIPAAALLGAFSMLWVGELSKGLTHVITFAVSAVCMAVCLVASKRWNLQWLREWALGFSILLGIVVAYLTYTPAA